MGQELVRWTGKPCSAQVVSLYALQTLRTSITTLHRACSFSSEDVSKDQSIGEENNRGLIRHCRSGIAGNKGDRALCDGWIQRCN